MFQNAGRPPLNDNVKLDLLLSLAENYQINSRKIVADTNISRPVLLHVLKKKINIIRTELIVGLNNNLAFLVLDEN